MLISAEKVLVDDKAAKPSLRLRGGEVVKVLGAIQPLASASTCATESGKIPRPSMDDEYAGNRQTR